MEVNNVATVCFFLAWCLLATTAIAPTSCHRAEAALEVGNATLPRRCHNSEYLIAYWQPEVKLMVVLDPEHTLGNSMSVPKPRGVSRWAGIPSRSITCGRQGRGHITPCLPKKNYGNHYIPFKRR
ncbi:hypothetical protein ACJRO7_035559 [Eucalyptus globulus]|uniref:Secreted protein n=1 Tax=Eucalyptus globulus TaxID=34317 RepID=A0ABD3J783_EUCGL